MSNDFENKVVGGYIYYTRFIASFALTELNPRTDSDVFRAWLEHLNLSEDDVNGIIFLAENGRLELEQDAKKFVASRALKY